MSLQEFNPACIGAKTERKVRAIAMRDFYRHLAKLKDCDWALAKKPPLDHFSYCKTSEGFMQKFLSPACMNLGAQPQRLPPLIKNIIVQELRRLEELDMKKPNNSDNRLVFSDVADSINRRANSISFAEKTDNNYRVLSPGIIDVIFATGIMINEGMIPFYKELFEHITNQISVNLKELPRSEERNLKDSFLFLVLMRDIVALNDLGQNVFLPTMRYVLGDTSGDQHNYTQVLNRLKMTSAGKKAKDTVEDLFEYLSTKMKLDQLHDFHHANGLTLQELHDNLLDGWVSCLFLNSDGYTKLNHDSKADLQGSFSSSVIDFSKDLAKRNSMWVDIDEYHPNAHFFEEETIVIMKDMLPKMENCQSSNRRKEQRNGSWKNSILTFLKNMRKELSENGKWPPRERDLHELPRGQVLEMFKEIGVCEDAVNFIFPTVGDRR